MKVRILSILSCLSLMFIISGCNISNCNLLDSFEQDKGKYFVDSQYIISYVVLSSTTTSNNGKITYGIDIIHESDIELNYLSYKCELYSNDTVIETFEGEVPMQSLFSKFVPLKTSNQYEHAKVVCTGYSDENPDDFVRLNAMSPAQMRACQHKDLITASINDISTNNKNDFLLLNFSSATAFGDFRFFYDTYKKVDFENVQVCVDCGYYLPVD